MRNKTSLIKGLLTVTIIDAMNYMGRDGWVFINAYPVRNGQTEIFHFAFKKQFPRSALQ